MGKTYEECFEVGKFYKDGDGRICQVVQKRTDDGKLLIRMDNGSGGYTDYWHEADGSYGRLYRYSLVPGEVTPAGTPIDPSSQRDADHLPLPVPGHKDFDSFPDLADWGVTSGTQEQPKPASGWWARG